MERPGFKFDKSSSSSTQRRIAAGLRIADCGLQIENRLAVNLTSCCERRRRSTAGSFYHSFNEPFHSGRHLFLQQFHPFFIFRGPLSFECYFLCYERASSCHIGETPMEFHRSPRRGYINHSPSSLFYFRQFPLVWISALRFRPAFCPRNEGAFQLRPFNSRIDSGPIINICPKLPGEISPDPTFN